MENLLIEILANISEEKAPKGVPCDPQVIEESEHEYGIELPDDYKTSLSQIGHGTIIGPNQSIYIERASSTIGWNQYEEFDVIPGMFVIGDDGGGGVYYYDTQNALGLGEYAMFLVHLGSISPEYSRFVGYNLKELIAKILQGTATYDDLPTLGRRHETNHGKAE